MWGNTSTLLIAANETREESLCDFFSSSPLECSLSIIRSSNSQIKTFFRDTFNFLPVKTVSAVTVQTSNHFSQALLSGGGGVCFVGVFPLIRSAPPSPAPTFCGHWSDGDLKIRAEIKLALFFFFFFWRRRKVVFLFSVLFFRLGFSSRFLSFFRALLDLILTAALAAQNVGMVWGRRGDPETCGNWGESFFCSKKGASENMGAPSKKPACM